MIISVLFSFLTLRNKINSIFLSLIIYYTYRMFFYEQKLIKKDCL